MTVDPVSAAPVTFGVVELDGETGTVAVMVGIPVTGPGRALRWTSSSTMLLRPVAPLV